MAIVKSVMKKNVITATPDETVADVAKRMKDNNQGAILLFDEGNLVGIFTERDCLNRVAAEGLNPKDTLVKDVASGKPIVINESAHVKDCAEILKDQGFRHLPVVDDDGKNVGIVTSRDLFIQIADELEQVIDKSRQEGEAVSEDLDIYEFVGGGGYGVPR